MNLPRLLVLTDRFQCKRGLLEVVSDVVEAGARAVVLREKDLPPVDRAELAQGVRRLLEPVAGLLALAGPDGEAVHLAAADAFPCTRPHLVGRSCHNAAELAAAGDEGCDYVTVSPVFPSASKPGYGPVLGIDGLAALISAGVPSVYALGGIRPADVAACRAVGATGVAVMGPIMRDPRLTADYLNALRKKP